MIVLDVESSGTEPNEHSILSLGALDLDNPSNRFYEECRMWDGAKIEAEASAINGFGPEEANDPAKQTEAALVQKFIAWTEGIEERTFAAQNVSFDFEFVRAACKRAHLEFPFAKRTIDTHTLVWAHMKNRGLTPPTAHHHSAINLAFALSYCGVPEEPIPHNGLTGALSHAEVIARIAYNKKILPEFSTFEIPWMTN